MRCKLCELISESTNFTRIAVFSSGVAFVNFDQTYLGRSMIVVAPHYDSLLEMPPSLTLQLMEDVKTLTHAIKKAYQPERVNYMMLGNTVLHAHCHIIPRYRDAPAWSLAPELPPMGEYEMHDEDFYTRVVQAIRDKLG